MQEYVVVNLFRWSSGYGSDGEMQYPWGLEVSKAAGLIGCPKGIAARSKKARECIGMTIAKVDQTEVHSADDVTHAIAGRTSITLFFIRPETLKKEAPAPACQVKVWRRETNISIF